MSTHRKMMDNHDIPSQHLADRKFDLQCWSKGLGQLIAEEEGIQMTDEHWDVIHCLRGYYLENGPARNGRELGDMLEYAYADRGGRKYLRTLFPNGPVGQGMRIAGLKVPPGTEYEGFGTSR